MSAVDESTMGDERGVWEFAMVGDDSLGSEQRVRDVDG